jgi:hypothetical protein
MASPFQTNHPVYSARFAMSSESQTQARVLAPGTYLTAKFNRSEFPLAVGARGGGDM